MILYHFTSIERLRLIQVAGFIKTTESNIGRKANTGPPVVWLTDDPDAPAALLAIAKTLDGTDKGAVRITVDLPDDEVYWWRDFADEHRMPRELRRELARGYDPDLWWVIPRPVSVRDEVVVIERRDGDPL